MLENRPAARQGEKNTASQDQAGQAAANFGSWHDVEGEILVHPSAPCPFVSARRHTEAGEGRVVIGRSVGQGTAGHVAHWHDKCDAAADADDVSRAAIGADKISAPETRRSYTPQIVLV